MAEPLVARYGLSVVHTIADAIAAVHPAFNREAFIADCCDGFEMLGLMDRGRKIARTLRQHLPDGYAGAIEILMKSVPETRIEHSNMSSFVYLPHVYFVAEYGLDHFDASMDAQYELTQRFTAEFSIRNYLEKYPAQTLARLETWITDPSPHVRRLVSEGTRPRLPWAKRLPQFQQDPAPVIRLLEQLKDDESLYVRRSVANNLNDIWKDHPDVVIEVARTWLKDAPKPRRQLVLHALRNAIKQGNVEVLELIGFRREPEVVIRDIEFTPAAVRIGQSVSISFVVENPDSQTHNLLVDVQVGYVKANGALRNKVFKLTSIQLQPGQSRACSLTLKLHQMTTRTHHVGVHPVAALINGKLHPLGNFTITE